MREGALLLIDASNTEYRAAAAHARLTGPDGAFTGGVYGILSMITRAIQRTGARHVVWCKDSSPYLRSVAYPEYKRLRKSEKDPELEERVKETRQHLSALLGVMGIPSWELPGYEADDLIALGVHQVSGRYQRIVAMTNDSDAGPIYVFPNFHVYDSGAEKGQSPYRLLADLVGAPVERAQAGMLVRALALSGTHNEVQGLPGIGPKRAWNIVSSPAKWDEAYAQHQVMIDRNIALISLPHPNLKRQLWSFPMPGVVGKFDSRALYRWSTSFGITITSQMVSALEQISHTR